MAASTTVLPPLNCTRGWHRHQAAVVFAARSVNCGRVCGGLCRAENPLAVFACSCLFCGLCACCPFFACHAHCPSSVCPPSFASSLLAPFTLLRLPLFIAMCARIGFRASSLSSNQHVCKLQDSRWQLQHGPAVAARAPVHLF